MNRFIIYVLTLCTAAFLTQADTPFQMEASVAKQNRAGVEAHKKDAYWKNAPFAVCTVDPLSGIRRDPSTFPVDGSFTEPMRVIAARDEYEGASLLLFGFNDLDGVLLSPKDLKSEGGASFECANIDIKVVKVWYQQGTAWGSFFSDPLRRLPTPELLVYDDALINVDHINKENFLRCDYKDAAAYRWISFNAAVSDHSYDGGIRNNWIHDADVLKPFPLRKNEFKQLILTFRIPENQKPGLYKGTIAASVGGKNVCDIPVELKVFPFALPSPKTFYNSEKPFMVAPFMGGINLYKSEKLARNMVRHNVKNCLLPAINSISEAKEARAMLEKVGFDTKHLFTALPGCGVRTSYPAVETDMNYQKHVKSLANASKSMAAIREVFGPDTKAYSYGIDEGNAAVVRSERATWQGIHKVGGNTIVATRFHPYILFNLDFADVPRHPRSYKKADADAFHAGNPDGIMAWYADPHSGPENPDYTRRVYGWQTWRNNYDASGQYILFRDNWNDFYVPAEAFLRGLMLVYPQDNDILDTLAWEAVREAVDDVRYGTLLKEIAEKARLSKNVETSYAAKASLSWISQVDCEHSSMDYLRLEMASRILDLTERLSKEGK